jgi:hypothetical protein
MRCALLAVLVFSGCGGSVPLPFEGHWTGVLLRDFECASGGGASADILTDWTISRSGDDLSITTTAPDCPTLTASLAPGAEDEARMDVARCTTTAPERADAGGIVTDGGIVDDSTNTRTWTDGRLRLRQGGSELLVDAWEHDEGTAGGQAYICDGLSFGSLALEGG